MLTANTVVSGLMYGREFVGLKDNDGNVVSHKLTDTPIAGTMAFPAYSSTPVFGTIVPGTSYDSAMLSDFSISDLISADGEIVGVRAALKKSPVEKNSVLSVSVNSSLKSVLSTNEDLHEVSVSCALSSPCIAENAIMPLSNLFSLNSSDPSECGFLSAGVVSEERVQMPKEAYVVYLKGGESVSDLGTRILTASSDSAKVTAPINVLTANRFNFSNFIGNYDYTDSNKNNITESKDLTPNSVLVLRPIINANTITATVNVGIDSKDTNFSLDNNYSDCPISVWHDSNVGANYVRYTKNDDVQDVATNYANTLLNSRFTSLTLTKEYVSSNLTEASFDELEYLSCTISASVWTGHSKSQAIHVRRICESDPTQPSTWLKICEVNEANARNSGTKIINLNWLLSNPDKKIILDFCQEMQVGSNDGAPPNDINNKMDRKISNFIYRKSSYP